MKPIPPIGDRTRLELAFNYMDVVRAIAYTNILHLCSGDPEQWIKDNVETWNQQINYAEIVTDSLISNRWIAVRGRFETK